MRAFSPRYGENNEGHARGRGSDWRDQESVVSRSNKIFLAMQGLAPVTWLIRAKSGFDPFCGTRAGRSSGRWRPGTLWADAETLAPLSQKHMNTSSSPTFCQFEVNSVVAIENALRNKNERG